jgi:5'-nucleotidase
MKKPLILVTNDDGIYAKGIAFLVEIMKEIGTVWVVAPDKGQSGMGHAITLSETLHLKNLPGVLTENNSFSCSGTPVDCVKIGIHEVLKQKPDVLVSGVNHGSNAAINVIYSGTMSAAIEGGIEGVPSVGFSLCDLSADADFEPCKAHIKKIVLSVLENGMPENTVLNVNFPKTNNIKGIKICQQAKAFWEEKFEKRTNPFGKDYYWLTGEFVNKEPNNEETDEWALANNYTSVVPMQFDFTAYNKINEIKNWNL